MDHVRFLQSKGFHVSSGWVEQWERQAQCADPTFRNKSVSAKQTLLCQEVLRSNLHLIGTKALPTDLQVFNGSLSTSSPSCTTTQNMLKMQQLNTGLAVAGMAQAAATRAVCVASR